MKSHLTVLKKLLFLPAPLLIPFLPVCTALLLYSFLSLHTTHPVAILSYALSAYTLTALCLRLPRALRYAKHNSKLLGRWKTDLDWRVKLSLGASLSLNTAYAIFQLVLGLYHRSVWFYMLAAYYTLLVGMRFTLLRYTRANTVGSDLKNELSRYRFCGYLLAVMNVVLGGILFFIAHEGRVIRHHEITTITMAAYTFAALGIAILGLVRYRKRRSPVYTCAKAISLAAALVSMLTLESAMLTAFGKTSDQRLHRTMTTVFGTVVALFVLGMAIFIIAQATKQIKAIQKGATQENYHGQ